MQFVDIHTHRAYTPPEVISVYGFLLSGGAPAGIPGKYWAGIHPWDTAKASEKWLEPLHAKDPDRWGIGEIGLDFHRTDLDPALQQHFLLRQLELAVNRQEPVLIHCIKAHNPMLEILKTYVPRLPAVIIHGFIGTPQLARQYLETGCLLCFGFGLLQSPKTQRTLSQVPLGKLLLETDDDRRDITVLYREMASLLQIDEETLKHEIYQTYQRISEKK